MSNDRIDQLKAALDQLEKNFQPTVRKLWDPGDWGRSRVVFFSDENVDLKQIALTYQSRLKAKKGKIQPYKLEAQLSELARVTLDLHRLITQGASNGVLGELSRTAYQVKRQASSPDPHKILNFWFPQPSDYPWGSECDESEDWWGDGIPALHYLAKLAAIAEKQVGKKKQAPNGPRNHQSPMNWLLREIGIDVHLSKSPTTHVIPIAKKVHIWAGGDPPDANWGVTPWRELNRRLKAEPEQFWNNLKKSLETSPPDIPPRKEKRKVHDFPVEKK